MGLVYGWMASSERYFIHKTSFCATRVLNNKKDQISMQAFGLRNITEHSSSSQSGNTNNRTQADIGKR
jgi:hypothetical protein